MTIAQISNGDKGLSARQKINLAITEANKVAAKMELVVAATTDNIATFDAAGQVKDSAIPITTLTDLDQRIDNLKSTVSVASDTTPNPTGWAFENEYYLTALAGAAEFAAPSGTPVNGNTLLIRVKDDGTARALTYNEIYKGFSQTLPSTTVVDKEMYMGFIYNSATSKWDLISVVNEV